MELSATCMACIVRRQEEQLRSVQDEAIKSDYLRRVLSLLAEIPENVPAPVATEQISVLHEAFFGAPFSFRALKQKYNAYLLEREPDIAKQITSSADPLLTALRFARAGNYIDFGAMGAVDDQKLRELLDRAAQEPVDEGEYAAFCTNLQTARTLVYCTDNCGEIVLDKLFIRQLKAKNPALAVTVLVRGKEVLNDATEEDAREVGLDGEARILSNGCGAAGTHLPSVSQEARDALETADLIVSKGQGNFEGLHGCGLNIYYLFLCKCEWFTQRFGLQQYQGVFVNERNHAIE